MLTLYLVLLGDNLEDTVCGPTRVNLSYFRRLVGPFDVTLAAQSYLRFFIGYISQLEKAIIRKKKIISPQNEFQNQEPILENPHKGSSWVCFGKPGDVFAQFSHELVYLTVCRGSKICLLWHAFPHS